MTIMNAKIPILDHISFVYQGKEVLHDITVTLSEESISGWKL